MTVDADRGERLDHDVVSAVRLRAARQVLDLPVRHLDGVRREKDGVRFVDESSTEEWAVVHAHELSPAVADRCDDWPERDDLQRWESAGSARSRRRAGEAHLQVVLLGVHVLSNVDGLVGADLDLSDLRRDGSVEGEGDGKGLERT